VTQPEHPGEARPLLEVRDLHVSFRTPQGTVHAVNGVDFTVAPGETVAIVGESGSGKSASMMSILGLLPRATGRVERGTILFRGRDLLSLSQKELRAINGRDVGMVFQDPMSSLNPVFTVGFQLREAIRLHERVDRNAADARATELLRLVGIADPGAQLSRFPHQFSGGMRQRLMIAMALACSPALLIADEPTTALDVTIQAQILRLVRDIQDRTNMATIWITHDLGVVARITRRVMVMYGGRIVEDAPVDALYAAPRHPYSMGLLASLPLRRTDRCGPLPTIGGQPPDMMRPPRGCTFAPRCPFAVDRCREAEPPLVAERGNRRVACWRSDEIGGQSDAA
jgi:oligopeptide/dipeptide ABC transporter ATP-binding protein